MPWMQVKRDMRSGKLRRRGDGAQDFGFTSASRSSRRSTALILQRKANVGRLVELVGFSPLAERLGPFLLRQGVFRAREQEERRDAAWLCAGGRHLAAKARQVAERLLLPGVGTRTARTPPASICRASHFASALSIFPAVDAIESSKRPPPCRGDASSLQGAGA